MPEARAYLGDGRLELDNNICERSIRPVAPGRKNCLFPGSVGGGEAAAIAYALIETAEMNNVDPEAWLTWVLERIADHRLTPSTNSCRGTGSPKTSKTRPDRTDTLQAQLPKLSGRDQNWQEPLRDAHRTACQRFCVVSLSARASDGWMPCQQHLCPKRSDGPHRQSAAMKHISRSWLRRLWR